MTFLVPAIQRFEVDELERVSLEEEVLDTTINGHDDDGADDGAENIDEPQGSNPINAFLVLI